MTGNITLYAKWTRNYTPRPYTPPTVVIPDDALGLNTTDHFAYIHSEKDILKLVTTLIANTKGEGKAGDDFWVSATRSQTVKSLRTSNGFPLFGELVV